MVSLQLLNSLGQCPDVSVLVTPEHYELARAWIDFLFGKIEYAEINNIFTTWVAKNLPSISVDQVSRDLQACEATLKGLKGA